MQKEQLVVDALQPIKLKNINQLVMVNSKQKYKELIQYMIW